ncbi:MAG: SDR family NAD(P)-dependent oxidoreductase [Parasphingorhabdus sp.]|uniref:SDR family oxidoreductase n=1 Tax=Parasphingorhabdus sp. TaxID=2709688 RepID=UPI00329A199A
MSIAGKHIVITGGASGLGLELVHQLQNNNKISVIARPSAGLDQLRTTYSDIHVYEAELHDLGQVEAAADQIVKDHQAIDILINNAAVQYTPKFLDDDFCYRHIKREIDVNFTSICALTYLMLPALLNSKSATILNVNSGLGLVPKKSSAIYCATKGALNIFSQSLRHQFQDTNITVKQAFLPLVDTAMTRGRGTGKLPADHVAATIIAGLTQKQADIDIGKVKLLRPMARFFPALARQIMKVN